MAVNKCDRILIPTPPKYAFEFEYNISAGIRFKTCSLAFFWLHHDVASISLHAINELFIIIIVERGEG